MKRNDIELTRLGITPVRTVHAVGQAPILLRPVRHSLECLRRSLNVGAHRHTTAKREATFVFLETECVTKDGCLFQLVCYIFHVWQICTTKQRSYNMSRIRSRDTRPEMKVRSMVHRMGYR